MDVKALIKKLSKYNPDTEIVGVEDYDRMLSTKIRIKEFEHNGKEHDPFHSERMFDSNVEAGNYILITFE